MEVATKKVRSEIKHNVYEFWERVLYNTETFGRQYITGDKKVIESVILII